MDGPLSDEMREMIVGAARNAAISVELLKALQSIDRMDAAAALVTALTAIIASTYAPEHRLTILNQLIGPTVVEWSKLRAGESVQ